MAVELVTFALFLGGFAWSWRSDANAFASGQGTLHPASGLRGTVLLLVGSGLAYAATGAYAEQARRRAAAMLLATAACGGAFAVNKALEYADPSLVGVTLSSSAFWFNYLFLTGLHLLHVLLGVAALPWVAWRVSVGAADRLTVEAIAAYWHLVDVVWLLLFPMIYLVHP